ncbi:methylamine utilization protein MauJ [Methylotuvimicrobium sp.]|uniref:methylamine utilization protein MauJ n=1 Tax=Methylotuvimicrobium sp. TaxID=2822413 RepID=UPI003D657EB5
MANAYGFDTGTVAQGTVFALNAPARKDRIQAFGLWEVELRKGVAYLCVRGGTPDQNKPLETVAVAAHAVAEDFLDIVAVEERTALLVAAPHDNVVWRTGPHGLKMQLTTSIVFAAEPGDVQAVVKDAAGNIVPSPAYVPPQHHPAYRYFRYSQASQNVFDAYRNMFLALESVLDLIAPKKHREGETDWIRRAVRDATEKHSINFVPFVKQPGNDPVESFIDAHYSAVRCAVFHAKAAGGGTLRPGSLSDHDRVLHQLLAVQTVVEQIFKALFSVRLPNGGFFPSGFGHVLLEMKPVIDLLFGPQECPTVEQLLAEEKNLPQGAFGPARFEGIRPGYTDEWLFTSDIKPAKLEFTRIVSLRLIAYLGNSKLGAMGMFMIPVAEKMNRTLLAADLDLTGVSKLAVRIRCVLRNVQSPRRDFAS